MAQNNMYRVGDFVYFENSVAGPYQIRRIEELNKTGGNVEARVVLYHRRRDISNALLKIADQADRKFDEYYEEDKPEEEKNENGEESSQTQHSAAGHVVANGNSSTTPEKDKDKENEDEKEKEKEKEKPKSEDDNNEVKQEASDPDASDWGIAGLPTDSNKLDTAERHRLRQRELFLTRQVETLPATSIRGKCQVFLLSEVEPPEAYQREDVFFYSLVYDSTQLSLLADKGAIRVGNKHQAVIPDLVTEEGDKKMEVDDDDDEDMKENGNLMIDEEAEENGPAAKKHRNDGVQVTERETLIYHPYHSLTERDIDQFLIMARAVGTFARALDQSSSTKLPSLHMTAAYASRDVTLFHAMALLHQANYDIGKAVKYLVPPANKTQYPLEVDQATNHNTISLGGPLLCRDQMEEWSAPEANLFEEAMEKLGKDFNDVHADYLPWKSMRDIIEYYYMWKASNRYAEMKKKKAADRENKLKQVYIPNFNNKPTPNLVGQHNTGTTLQKGSSPCESCKCTEALNWYAWGPASQQLRLCQDCWIYWKKYGGLKVKHQYDRYDLEAKENNDDQEDNKAIAMSGHGLLSAIGKQTQSNQHQQIVAKLAQLHASQLQQFAQKTASGNSAGVPPQIRNKSVQGKVVNISFNATVWWRLMRKVVLNIAYFPSKMARKPLKEIDVAEMFNAFQNASLETKLNAARALWSSKCTPEFQVAIKRMHDALAAGHRPSYTSLQFQQQQSNQHANGTKT